jgi:hypothetical protein
MNATKTSKDHLRNTSWRSCGIGINLAQERTHMNFLDELLAEVEEQEGRKRIEMDLAKADQLLMALSQIDSQSEKIDRVATEETALIESWRTSEQERLGKKRNWLSWNLQQFLNGTGEKTIRLAHGVIKSRLSRDRCDISDIDKFNKVAGKYGLLRTYPERSEPDLSAVLGFIKAKGGEIPPGVEFIPGTPKFSYTLTKKGNGNGTEQRNTSEIGA